MIATCPEVRQHAERVTGVADVKSRAGLMKRVAETDSTFVHHGSLWADAVSFVAVRYALTSGRVTGQLPNMFYRAASVTPKT